MKILMERVWVRVRLVKSLERERGIADIFGKRMVWC